MTEERTFKTTFFQQVWNRVHKNNKNCLIIVAGDTGSGKSYVALRVAEVLDPSFRGDTINNRCLFTAEEFTNALNNGNLKRGNVLIFDEAGVGLPAREWYNFSNKALNYILQTFRFRNLIVLFTVPSISFIDSQARKLFNYVIQTKKIDRIDRKSIVKIYRVQHNPKMDKTYYKSLVKLNGMQIDKTSISIPSVKVRNAYEKLHTAYKTELSISLDKEVSLMAKDRKDRKERRLINEKEIVEDVLRKKDKYVKLRRDKVHGGYRHLCSESLIQIDYNIGGIKSRRIKQEVEHRLKELDKKKGQDTEKEHGSKRKPSSLPPPTD